MKIQPIVEGLGEVEAVPILLRRLISASGAAGLSVGRPIRKKRSELVQEGPLRTAVRLALRQSDCRAIIVLFDGDDDCPKQLAPRLETWARAEAGSTPCAVVMAQREYEAWFLATIESLRGRRGIRSDAVAPADPEAPRGAKGALEKQMEANQSYAETADQAPLTATFDLAIAYRRCRSFRRMTRAFGLLASEAGVTLSTWPPTAWTSAAP